MYSFHLSRYLDKGMTTESKDVSITNEKYYDNMSSIISSDYNTKMYIVDDVPKEMTKSLTYYLKKSLPKGIKMDIVTQVMDSPIDWTSSYMVRIKGAWTEKLKTSKPKTDKNKLNDPTEYTTSRSSRLAIDSWNLIAEKTSEGCRTIDEEMIVLLRYPRRMPLKEQVFYEGIWFRGLKANGITVSQVKNNVREMLYSISPTRCQDTTPVKLFNRLLDENVAYFESLLPGKIDGSRVFMGVDVLTNMLVFNDLLTTGGGAMNMMFLAETGRGKSYYIKFLTYMLLALKVNVVIWDKDGEYSTLSEAMGYSTISLGKNGGSYFNTVPIMSDGDVEAYDTSKQDTMAIFDVLCDADVGMTKNEKFIIESAYTDVLESSGVTKERISTWSNSSGLDYKDIYKGILRLSNITDDIREEYSNLKRKLSTYFEDNGMTEGLFKVPIDIEDFLHVKDGGQPLLLNINMQTSDTTDYITVNKELDKIKSITMSSLTDRIVKYSKRQGELTAVIVEEFQRHTVNKSFVKKVHTCITGGRKLNMIPILVTNSLDSIIDNDNPLLRDIVSNISTVVVGCLEEKAMDTAIECFGLDNCKAVLTKIASETENKSSMSAWKHSFLMKIKSESRVELAVVKAHLPPEMDKLFKTREDL